MKRYLKRNKKLENKLFLLALLKIRMAFSKELCDWILFFLFHLLIWVLRVSYGRRKVGTLGAFQKFYHTPLELHFICRTRDTVSVREQTIFIFTTCTLIFSIAFFLSTDLQPSRLISWPTIGVWATVWKYFLEELTRWQLSCIGATFSVW